MARPQSLTDSDLERIAWLHRQLGGSMFVEPPLCPPDRGNWPPGTDDHRVDAVHIPHLDGGLISDNIDPTAFGEALQHGATLIAAR